MLPSMPILFTRDSQDAFGNKIEPSTSFFNQNIFEKPVIISQALPTKAAPVLPKVPEATGNTSVKKNDQVNDDNKIKIKDNPFETALVKSFYTKVQSRFSSLPTVPSNKFVQFQGILKSFNPSKETPIDLYKKIEFIFGEEHKDIVEEFLLFLKPGQAAKVGRFMDRFKLVQMTNFIGLLQTTFARKPTVLRKILRALTTGINTGSSEEMKARVLPHLRSNPRLTQMFKALFPDERPPDSVYETGTDTMNENFLTADKGYDVWEFEDTNDNKRNLESKDRLDTMYLHGRVFLQHGRMLRTARVTYPYSKEPYRVHMRRLAPTHCHLSPPESEDERSSPKRQSKNNPKIPPKKSKKQLKSPTKTAKDVNDNTSKDLITNSPKTVRKNQSKAKACKEKKEDKAEVLKKEKKEKNDVKHQNKKDEGTKVKNSKMEAIIVEKQRPTVKGNWTREEDKTMLQVLKGEASSEEVFGRISELLPHRSVTEIKERFCHVMNLLQQMAVGEVT